MNTHPMYHEVPPPDALDDAVKCLCGGEAVWHRATDDSDVEHLHCSNPRCGRIVAGEYRTIEQAVALWNQELKQESCDRHSWFVTDPTHVRCGHCGKVERIGE